MKSLFLVLFLSGCAVHTSDEYTAKCGPWIPQVGWAALSEKDLFGFLETTEVGFKCEVKYRKG